MLMKDAPPSMTSKFCSKCGQPQVEKQVGYDGDTGEPVHIMVCHNPKCTRGCNELTGHKFGFFGLSSTCKLCGWYYTD